MSSDPQVAVYLRFAEWWLAEINKHLSPHDVDDVVYQLVRRVAMTPWRQPFERAIVEYEQMRRA